MIELAETSPAVHVDPAEYRRLLGYPRDAAMSERAGELAEWAREWYSQNGRPWVYARQAESLEGIPVKSEAHGAVLAAVSAGPELEEEAQKLWREEKPDEYFFLEMFGSAVVEHLVGATGARLCEWAEARGLSVLPHYSPGYSDWDIAEQKRLLERIGPARLPGRLEAFESGALRPKKSQLAVFGLSCLTDRERLLPGHVSCGNCTLRSCQFRRPPKYTVNAKALKRWAAERLTLSPGGDGSLDARFLYEGTTCTNMGRPLAFEYFVKLGPREEGRPILEQRCSPAAGDCGHMAMCQYSDHLMASIANDAPLRGRPLRDVIGWQRPMSAAGCYCEPVSREHKWGLVLETIHYALNSNPINSSQ